MQATTLKQHGRQHGLIVARVHPEPRPTTKAGGRSPYSPPSLVVIVFLRAVLPGLTLRCCETMRAQDGLSPLLPARSRLGSHVSSWGVPEVGQKRAHRCRSAACYMTGSQE